MKPAKDMKDTLRYQHMVARLKSQPIYKKEAALMQEIAKGRQWRIDAAIEAIDVSEKYGWKQGYIYSMGPVNLLKQAAMFGRLETMKKLCKRFGFEVEKGGFYLHDPVSIAYQIATLQGHTRVADYLHNSCNASTENRGAEWTPSAMQCALDDKNLRKIDFLVSHGGNAGRALLEAVNTPDADINIVRHLVEKRGADVNTKAENFWSPFSQSVKYGHNEIAKYLLEKGATPQNDNSASQTMYDAAYRNNVEMIRVMLGIGMKADQRDFTQALFGKAYDAAKVILTEGGVDINSNQHGALVYAIRSLTPEAVKFCLDNGADVAGTLADVKANSQWKKNEEASWNDMISKLEAMAPKPAAPEAPKPPQP